jgi:AP-1 complex subunit beta-1
MGCINVKTISEYLCECIGNALKDQDPYVRKTAAVGVSKLFAVNPELVEDCAYIEELRNLISDTNAMVVSNAVASLAEMSERTGRDFFQMNSGVLSKLLNAMTQCTEWGMVYILDCLAKYEPDPQEAQDVVERVSANLNHSNAAVLLSTVRVVVRYLDRLQNPLLQQKLLNEKLPPPLVSLVMNHRPEVQYVALTNINLIIQKAIQLQKKVDAEEKAPPQPGKTPIVPGLRPGLILSEQVQTFFCRYNDPTYLKMEKLEIMVKLVNMRNIDKVLMEFKTYCTEVDVEFVRKSVLAIGYA